MRRFTMIASLACVTWLLHAENTTLVEAGGFGGRGGGRSFGGGRPSMGGARPSFSGGRAPMSRPQPSRPQFNRPSVGQPSFSRPPVNRPSSSLPHLGGGNVSRPSVNRPSPSRPSLPGGGTSRPNVQRPSTTLPNRPGNSRPSTTLPGNTRPGVTRPGISQPNIPGIGSRPGNRPPSAGDLGDFLGLDRPVRPGDSSRAGIGNTRPGTPGNFPDLADRFPNGPGDGQRPQLGDLNPSRPGLGSRPGKRPSINVGDLQIGDNTVIGNRPSWAQIDRDRVNQINGRWQNNLGALHGWPTRYPDRFDRYHRWGDSIRGRWGRYPYFGPRWWSGRRFAWGTWSYFYAYNAYPYTYWWSTPTYTQCAAWFTWSAPASSWQEPVYYDYGSGGNVTYEDNRVYIAGQDVASEDEFAESAAVLASAPDPESDQDAQDAEWLPLGTFALTTDADDVDPSRIVQLAVNRDGIVSGVLYNKETDRTDALQGRVDKETQRVAIRIGESEDIVAETGLYNLTQDEASVLVHFGTEQHDTYLLVRLSDPPEDDSDFLTP
ncbi:MAG: mu-protocadherin- cell-suface protein [Planctomycetota bacterium]